MAVHKSAAKSKRILSGRHGKFSARVPARTGSPASMFLSRFFRRRRTTGASGTIELNSPVLFFIVIIIVLIAFLTVAFIGAYYFTQGADHGRKSQNSLRNSSLSLTQQAADYRNNQNANSASNLNANRPPACTALTSLAACQARPDCMIEDLCDCDTAKTRAQRCDFQLQPYEICTCEQSGYGRCVELVCPID
jgi:hypothetical protein